MPFASTRSFIKRRKGLLMHVRRIIKSGILHLQNEGKTLNIVFALDLHFIKAAEINKLKFGRPEGIRLLVQGETTFAVDFRYSPKGIKLIQVLNTSHLDQFITALNLIGNEVSNIKQPCYVDYLQFLFSPGYYLMVRKKGKSNFYKFDGTLQKVSHAAIRKELSKIIADRKKVSQP